MRQKKKTDSQTSAVWSDGMTNISFPPAYGTYSGGKYYRDKAPDGMYQMPRDGVHIRVVHKLGVPYVDICCHGFALGKTMNFPVCIGYAVNTEDKARIEQAIADDKAARAAKQPSPHPDLLLCIREASRTVHRERDAAQEAYQCGRHILAGNARQRKEHWYRLKDRGIATAHKQGLLRYVGASPQGMAVYEYGEGGTACFHSTWHPVGAERTPVAGHPETLLVEAKAKIRGISLRRVEVTLDSLPSDLSGYVRSAQPRIGRTPQVCYECGEEGHIARYCPERDFDDEDDYPASFGGII